MIFFILYVRTVPGFRSLNIWISSRTGRSSATLSAEKKNKKKKRKKKNVVLEKDEIRVVYGQWKNMKFSLNTHTFADAI